MNDTLIETPDWFPSGKIDVGSRVILDVMTPNAFAGQAGTVLTFENDAIATILLDDNEGTIAWIRDRLIWSPYQGEEVVSIDGDD